MIKEKGELLVGVEHGGKMHTSFELRPQLVKDTIEVMEGADAARAANNAHFCGACLVAKQIESLGDIPKEKITPDLVLSLTDVDFSVVQQARETLEQRLRSFRSGPKAAEKDSTGTP